MVPYFIPYIGKNYQTGNILPRRLLILGDSHYCGECAQCGIKGMADSNGFGCLNFTREVVAKYLEYRQGKRSHESWMNTYLKFEKALAGHETDDAESLKIWNSVAFYNYIQTAYISESRQAYTSDDYAQSFPYVKKVMNDLNPDVIIVWGNRLWSNLPNENWRDGGVVSAAGIEEDFGYYSLSNGKKVLTIRVTHPSAGFPWEAYGEIIKKAFTL